MSFMEKAKRKLRESSTKFGDYNTRCGLMVEAHIPPPRDE